MTELSHIIEHLLLTHACVVVPQFGAFVTMATSASRTDEEDVFFPPVRTVRFNQDMTEDDGLIVGALQRIYHNKETEAKRKLQTLVLDLRQQLLADGQVDFGSLGLFMQDEDGHVSFQACQAGAVTPDFYGLDAFAMPKLPAKPTIETAKPQSTDKHLIIRISHRSLRYAALVAAVLVTCALVIVPQDSPRLPQASEAGINLWEQFTETITKAFHRQDTSPSTPQVQAQASATQDTQVQAEQPQPSTPVASVSDDTPAADEDQAEAPTEESPTEENIHSTTAPAESQASTVGDVQPAVQRRAPKPRRTKSFCIVVASATTERNAKAYVKDLRSRGFDNARVSKRGNMVRVILAGFASDAEAHKEASILHEYEEFELAWVMETPSR